MHQFIWPFWPTSCTFLQIPAAQEAGFRGILAYCEKIFLNSGPLFKISRNKDASLCSVSTWNLPGSFSPNLSFSPRCEEGNESLSDHTAKKFGKARERERDQIQSFAVLRTVLPKKCLPLRSLEKINSLWPLFSPVSKPNAL